MIIKGRPSILDGPTMFNGLNRSVAEIVAEANENFKKDPLYQILVNAGMSTTIASVDDPSYIELSRREGIMDVYFASQAEQAKQYEIQRIAVQKEIEKAAEIKRSSDQQTAEIEKELEKQRVLNTQFANATTDIERQNISQQTRNLIETKIQPKLISNAQSTINTLESIRGDGVINNEVINKSINDVINYTTSVINYQNVANDYIDGKQDINSVSQQFDIVDNNFVVLQKSIENMGDDVYTAALKAGVDLHTGLTTNVVNTTVIPETLIAYGVPDENIMPIALSQRDIPIKSISQETNSVLPLIAAAAAIYFGIGA